MPKTATLVLVRPPGFDGMDDLTLRDIIGRAIADREAHLREKHRLAGRKPLGRRAIRTQSAFDAPTSKAPRRKMSPRIAENDRWRRVEILQRLDAFIEAHRAAFEMWRAGFRDVVFPRGTYAMRRNAGVDVAPG